MERLREKGDLAGTRLDDDIAVLADGSSLLRVSFGGTSVGLGLEVMLFVRHDSCLFSLSLSLKFKTLSWKMTTMHVPR